MNPSGIDLVETLKNRSLNVKNELVLFLTSLVVPFPTVADDGTDTSGIVMVEYNAELSVTVCTTSAKGVLTLTLTSVVSFCPSVGCLARILGPLVSFKP